MVIIDFGEYRGRELRDIKDVHYLGKLAKDALPRVAVPDAVMREARAVLKARGYRFIGMRLEHDGPEGTAATDGTISRLHQIEDIVHSRRDQSEMISAINETKTPIGAETPASRETDHGNHEPNGDDDLPGSGADENMKGGTMEKKEVTRTTKVPCRNGCTSLAVKDGLCTKCYVKEHGEQPHPSFKKKAGKEEGSAYSSDDICEGIGNRVKTLRLMLGYSTIKAFAKALSTDNSRLGIIEKKPDTAGNEAKKRLIVKICRKFPEVSLEWLITGKGEMAEGVPAAVLPDNAATQAAPPPPEQTPEPSKQSTIAPDTAIDVVCMKVLEEYRIMDQSGTRAAVVSFGEIEDDESRDVSFGFRRCDVDFEIARANMDDWKFLGALAQQIDRLCKVLA